MKRCTKCLEDKPRSEFYKNNSAKDGLRPQCKSCTQSHNKRYYLENKGEMNEYSKRYYLKNKDRIGEDELAARRREDRYKMSSEQYQKLLEDQNYACAICGKANANGRKLYVDHDHSCCFGSKSCGKCIRGLLCHKCNSGLGHFDDSVESMNKATEYIKKYSRKDKT